MDPLCYAKANYNVVGLFVGNVLDVILHVERYNVVPGLGVIHRRFPHRIFAAELRR